MCWTQCYEVGESEVSTFGPHFAESPRTPTARFTDRDAFPSTFLKVLQLVQCTREHTKTAHVSMPPEIADSDAESEDLVNEGDQITGVTFEPPQPHGTESLLRVDFDPFPDPTQRLSDLPQSQNPLLSLGTGSTEKLIRDLNKAHEALASSSANGAGTNNGAINAGPNKDSSSPMPRKRGQSAVESGSTGGSENVNKKKRPKTYSTKSKTTMPASSDLFADVQVSSDESCMSQLNKEMEEASEITSMAPPQGHAPTRERDRPRRVVSLLQQSNTNPNHQISTSTSSMGNYESINLDFRASEGLDITANLFGNLSQASMDGHGVDTSQLENLHGNDELPFGMLQPDPAMPSGSFEQEMMTSPERLGAPGGKLEIIDPSTLLPAPIREMSPEIERPSKRRKTDMGGARATASPAPASTRRAASVSAESVSNASNGSTAKKRGRRPKATKLTTSSPTPDAAEDDHDQSAHAMNPPASPVRRSRRGTVDSSSQLSQASEPVSNTKRKRKTTKAEANKEQSSPAKNPSSELHLSDEALIGLPKEQYKPRPSRSRSKRSVDDDPSQSEQPGTEKPDYDTPQKPEAEIEVEIETPKPAKGKGKGKKSKVKRAKTSAAALKKSAAMFSDGEEDVLFMDEKPAAVKLDLPPDLKILKKEESVKPKDEEEDNEDEVKVGGRAKKNISIEIPAPTGADADMNTDPPKTAAPQPKKRGRKPKERTPAAPTPEPLTATEDSDTHSPDKVAVNEEATPARPTLAEKAANIPTPSIPALTPEKAAKGTTAKGKENVSPTHSPLKNSSISLGSRYRVGLSRRSIPSLLSKVDRTKKAPTKVSTTVKEKKVKATDGEDGEDGDGLAKVGLRDKNGELIEWEF